MGRVSQKLWLWVFTTALLALSAPKAGAAETAATPEAATPVEPATAVETEAPAPQSGAPAVDAPAPVAEPVAEPTPAPVAEAPAPAAEPVSEPAPAPVAAPEAATEAATEAAAEPVVESDPFASSMEGSFIEQFEAIEQELEVWVATKTSGTIEEAPAVLTVLRGDELRDRGYTSVADALRWVLGFYVSDDHSIPNASVRGISGGLWGESGNLKVMIDGHSVAFRPTAGNWLGAELVPMSAIERVEIVRGPASALYGADAFLGVVNIVTRSGAALGGADLRAGASRTTAFGHDLDGAVGTNLGKLDVSLFVRQRGEDRSGLALPSSSPAPVLPHRAGRTLESALADRSSTVGLLKLRYAAETYNVQLSGYLSSLDNRAEFSPWAQLTNGVDGQGREGVNRLQLLQGQVALKAQKFFSPDLDVTLDAVFFAGGVRGGDRLEVASDVYYVRRDLTSRGLDATLEGRWRLLPSLTVVAGAGLLLDREQLPAYERVLKIESGSTPAGTVVESSRVAQGWKNFLSPAVYGQALWTHIERYLRLIGGVRYDHHNIYGDQVSARLGAVSQPLDMVHLKLLYGSAFKAPSPWLLYARPYRSGDVLCNPDLEPQKVQTVEGEIAVKPWSWLSASTVLSYNYLTQKTEFGSEGVNLVARNLAEVSSLSWETRVEARWARVLSGYVSFEKQFLARNSGEEGYRGELVGEINEGAPEAVVRLGATGEWADAHLRLNAEAAWVGAREASAINVMLAGQRYTLDPYWLANATLTVFGIKLFPGATSETAISLAGRNLFDAQAADPGYSGVDYPLLGRSFELSLRQTF